MFLVETRSPNGKVLSITRRPNGRTTAAGTQERSVTMPYGANGFVSEITAPSNRKARYTYTSFNRIETVTDPEGGVTRYGHQPDRRDYAVDTVNRAGDDPFCSSLITVLANPNIGIPIKTIQHPGEKRGLSFIIVAPKSQIGPLNESGEGQKIPSSEKQNSCAPFGLLGAHFNCDRPPCFSGPATSLLPRRNHTLLSSQPALVCSGFTDSTKTA